MIRRFRIFLWQIISDLEQKLYPYVGEDSNDYYYTIKNDQTGESYMIIEWVKSFDERIVKLQEEMMYLNSELQQIKNND